MRDDDIHCSTLLLNPWPERQGWPIPADIQNDTLQEIACQVFGYASLHLDGPDAVADADAVQRHLDEGQPLFADLYKRAARN